MKLKKFVFFISSVIPILSACKREVPSANPNATFAKTYVIDGNQLIMGSIKAPDGGYLLWGSSVDIATKDPNGFLMKLDANQNLQWHKMVGGNRMDEIRSACYDNAGNIMATGMSISFDNANRKGEFPSMLTTYLSGSGDVIWEKYFVAPSQAANLSTVANKVLYLPNGSFALVGSTSNYQSVTLYNNKLTQVYRPFILTINNKGDTIGTASYDVLFDDRGIGKCYLNSFGMSALLTKDGSILLFVARENASIDSITKSLISSSGFMQSGITLFKIDPPNSFGYNNYTWKKAITNLKVFIGFGNSDTYFYPVPFKLVHTAEEQYLIGHPILTGRYVNYAILNKQGDLISNPIPSTELQSFLIDLEWIDGSLFLLSPISFSKLNLNGQVEWTHHIQTSFKTGAVSGIYPQEDKSMLIFCTSLNNKSDLDIGCIKFNALGEVLAR